MFLGFFVVAGFASGVAAAAPAHAACTRCVEFVVGPARYLVGPREAGDRLILDMPLLLRRFDDELRAYTANATTWVLRGDDVTSLAFDARPVIGRGARGATDECGSWLTAALRDGDVIRGWYHAEGPCAWKDGRYSAAMYGAYAESRDGGLTFERTGGDDNRILSVDTRWAAGATVGIQGPIVVQHGDWYYAYFTQAEPGNWFRTVARSRVADGGRPGTWRKFWRGGFTEPGVGGRASPLPGLPYHAVYALHSGGLIAAGTVGRGGLRVAFSEDAVNWRAVPEPLLFSDRFAWHRDAASPELIVYPSLGDPTGDVRLRDRFLLFYTFVRPFEARRTAIGVVREVTMRVHAEPVSPQVHVALSRFSDATSGDRHTTIAAPRLGQHDDGIVGHLATGDGPGRAVLVGCLARSRRDHVVRVGDCASGETRLRTLGWVSREPRADTHPLHQCRLASGNHFLSPREDCESLGVPVATVGHAWRPRPDLRVAQMAFETREGPGDGAGTVAATVVNGGGALLAGESFVVRVSLQDHEDVVTGRGHAASTTPVVISVPVPASWPRGPGPWALTAEVDPLGEVPETDESNNRLTVDLEHR